MNVHEEFAEDLALYALGSLERDERLALEKHLEECAGCRRELDLLRGDMSLLALSVDGRVPSAGSRLDVGLQQSRGLLLPHSQFWPLWFGARTSDCAKSYQGYGSTLLINRRSLRWRVASSLL